ncbi:MAG: hypothetical protein JNJ88_02390, partial [Planctomycetes bacterium]|nr:hypothetical protein [Planctomycetota bacterium]MBL8692924.1 hypothetical protein [Planctomycetota bacterium]
TRIDWSVQVSRIAAACERYGGPRVFVDSTGPGEPIVASLRSAGIRARPFVMSAQSKTDLINNLALLLEKGEVVLPRPELWSAGIEELESYEFSTSDAGNVRMSSPSGVHDDCVVALALALWPLRRRSEPIFLL